MGERNEEGVMRDREEESGWRKNWPKKRNTCAIREGPKGKKKEKRLDFFLLL
jgi:hypothetical protein